MANKLYNYNPDMLDQDMIRFTTELAESTEVVGENSKQTQRQE